MAMFKGHIVDFLKRAASLRTEELSEEEFSKRVLCAREQHAGGNFHSKVLWARFLRYRQVDADFPEEWKTLNLHAHDLCRELLKYASEEEDLPSEEALQRIYARWKKTRMPPWKRHRRQKVNSFMLHKESNFFYVQEIDASCLAILEKFPQARGSLLQHYRRALLNSIYDPRTKLRRSLSAIEDLINILEKEVIRGFLEGPQITEFSMEAWKVICDQAMSKWRPYEKRVAAKLGLDELVSVASGGSFHKPPYALQALLGPLDAPDVASAKKIQEDCLSRLTGAFKSPTRDSTISESLAKEVWGDLCREAMALQRYRDTFLSLESRFPDSKPERLLLLASFYTDCSSVQHLEKHGIARAADYVQLATMSPLHLLQQMVSFTCSPSNAATHGGVHLDSMIEWRNAATTEAKLQAFPKEAQELMDVLRVGTSCIRCGYEKIRHEILKSRAADEEFDFKVFCPNCKSFFSLEASK